MNDTVTTRASHSQPRGYVGAAPPSVNKHPESRLDASPTTVH
jgi:hypothetical protein